MDCEWGNNQVMLLIASSKRVVLLLLLFLIACDASRAQGLHTYSACLKIACRTQCETPCRWLPGEPSRDVTHLAKPAWRAERPHQGGFSLPPRSLQAVRALFCMRLRATLLLQLHASQLDIEQHQVMMPSNRCHCSN